jgi:uncharacterized protein YbjT (DUF2867 family)
VTIEEERMTILVTGATGTVGRSLVSQLTDAGHAVRALTRDPARADLPAGVEVVRGDLTDVGTLTAAFAGVEATHLITFTGEFGDTLTNGAEIVAALVAAGVARVSVLGGWDTSTVEPALDAAGVPWALLSPTEFMANTLVDHAETIRTTGEVRVFDLGRASPSVHEADIAAVALAVLTGAAPTGREYLLTGGEPVSLEQKLAAVSAATGQPVTLTRLSEADARAELAAAGTSEEIIEFTIALESAPPTVGSQPVGTVAEVTGRAPRTFAAWARENAEAFRPVP